MRGIGLILGPEFFDLLFFLLIFGAGLDFLVSGLSALIYGDINHMPKLFSYFYFKITKRGLEKYKGNCKFAREMFSFRAVIFYCLLGGFICTVMGLLMINSILFQK